MRTVFLTMAALAQIYSWIYIIYILTGYFRLDRNHILIRALDSVCEPVHQFIHNRLPRMQIGMMDFSPLYVLIGCFVLETLFKILARRFS